MLIETLKSIFERDLKKLSSEIESYKNEKCIWVKDGDISNSAGNLCLHLIGNLNGFIGNQLGNTGYLRQRDLEFSTTYVSKSDLIIEIKKTISMLNNTLDKITEDQLESEYPILVFKKKTSTYFFLVHLSTHLAYHLGQITFHRKVLDK